MNEREQLFKDIYNLHDEMRDGVLESGVQPEQYDFPLRNKEKMTNEELKEFYYFLYTFNLVLYKKLADVRKLRPKEFWDNLTLLFSQHKLREQRLLRHEQRKVREAWHAKYAPLTDTNTENIA